jgi:hypothetical protein
MTETVEIDKKKQVGEEAAPLKRRIFTYNKKNALLADM